MIKIECACGHSWSQAHFEVITCSKCNSSMVSMAEAARRSGISQRAFTQRLGRGLVIGDVEFLKVPGRRAYRYIDAGFTFRAPAPKPRKEVAPIPCALCKTPVPAQVALLQFEAHPGMREYYPHCPACEKRIAMHVAGIKAARRAVEDAYDAGLTVDD